MKKILIPTDFSPSSMAAYKFAIEFATLVKGEIVVVHVIDIPVIQETTFGLQPYLYAQEMFKEAVENSQRIYERMKVHYPTDVPVRFEAIHEDLITGLPEYIRNNHVDIVIMNTQGTRQLDEFLSGPKVKKFARHSPVPVLAVPREIPLRKIKHIVFPNTLEEDQNHLISAVIELQQTLKATLHLLYVNTPDNPHNEEESAKLLNGFAAYYNLENFTSNYCYDDSERSGILKFAREIPDCMIAMGTHGRTGFSQLWNGSIAESVMMKCDAPFWVSKLS